MLHITGSCRALETVSAGNWQYCDSSSLAELHHSLPRERSGWRSGAGSRQLVQSFQSTRTHTHTSGGIPSQTWDSTRCVCILQRHTMFSRSLCPSLIETQPENFYSEYSVLMIIGRKNCKNINLMYICVISTTTKKKRKKPVEFHLCSRALAVGQHLLQGSNREAVGQDEATNRQVWRYILTEIKTTHQNHHHTLSLAAFPWQLFDKAQLQIAGISVEWCEAHKP